MNKSKIWTGAVPVVVALVIVGLVFGKLYIDSTSFFESQLAEVSGTDIVDLGCCVTEIAVRETALLGLYSETFSSSDFIMTLNTDSITYSTTDAVKIWGTLEYVGDNDTVKIWHGCPFMLFSITDGNHFNVDAMQVFILTTSRLESNKVYHFDFQKSGAYDADAPDAEFWEKFYSESDLYLPEGEYTITLNGEFSLSENALEDKVGLKRDFPILNDG